MIEMTCLSEGPSPLDLALATRSNFRAILEDMAALLHQAPRRGRGPGARSPREVGMECKADFESREARKRAGERGSSADLTRSRAELVTEDALLR